MSAETRNWQPGDVAVVRSMYSGEVVAVRTGTPTNMGWAYSMRTRDGSTQTWHADSSGRDVVRPLVVIDPEDREQGERLARAIHDAIHKPGDFDSRTDMSREVLTDLMQSALREFANPTPPRPEEPTGLYARIEDSEGRVWVRTATQASVWRRESVNTHGYRYLIPKDGCDNYADIAAVRVLSEGVRDE